MFSQRDGCNHSKDLSGKDNAPSQSSFLLLEADYLPKNSKYPALEAICDQSFASDWCPTLDIRGNVVLRTSVRR